MTAKHDMSDAALARRSADGDEAAFVALIHRHGHKLRALARRQVEDAAAVEDVLQETLLTAWLGIGKLRHPERVVPWLIQVCRNRCRDHLRRAGKLRERTESADPEECWSRLGRGRPLGHEERADLMDALDRVPQAARQAARLFYLEGLTVAEVAERTDAPVGTVKRRLYDARTHLRHGMGVEPRERNRRRWP